LFTSGIKGFKMIESKIKHNGNLRDFNCNFEFKKSKMVPIKLEASLNTVILSNIDGSFLFTSGIKLASNLMGTILDFLNSKLQLKSCKLPLCLIFDSIVSNPSKSLLNFRSAANEVIPLNFVTKIEGYENLELDFNHVGETNRAVNKITIKPFTHKPVTLEADLQFSGITSFAAGSSMLTSVLTTLSLYLASLTILLFAL
jgi:hypothetical protein